MTIELVIEKFYRMPPPLAHKQPWNYGDVCLTLIFTHTERWGAGVETQKYVRGEVGGWGRVPFNEPYAPSLSTIYDGA